MILDAGPALNFLATNNTKILLGVSGGGFSAPETVRDEVLRKSRAEQRFRAAARGWATLGKRVTVLSDDLTPELEAVMRRLSAVPPTERMRQAKDLGETMVVAHAVVIAEGGDDVVVLIDEWRGAEMAVRERARLERKREQGEVLGRLRVINTQAVLKKAASTGLIADRSQMRVVYNALRACDDGLVDISQTDLLNKAHWAQA